MWVVIYFKPAWESAVDLGPAHGMPGDGGSGDVVRPLHLVGAYSQTNEVL